jgi:hypothetical protein
MLQQGAGSELEAGPAVVAICIARHGNGLGLPKRKRWKNWSWTIRESGSSVTKIVYMLPNAIFSLIYETVLAILVCVGSNDARR